MKLEGLRAQADYLRQSGHFGKPAVTAENKLKQNLYAETPNQVWVTDITYEGWLYPAMVRSLFSRQVIAWSMRSRTANKLAINALLMAVWQHNSKTPVIVHSDQGASVQQP